MLSAISGSPQRLVIALAVLAGVGCDTNPFQDPGTGCTVWDNDVARNNGFNINQQQPRRCPVGVYPDDYRYGGVTTPFEATISAPKNVPSGGTGNQGMDYYFYNDRG